MADMRQGDFADRQVVPVPTEDAVRIAQWRETGSRAALDALLRAHAGRVRAMARVWSRGGACHDDLVSEGMMAIMGCLGGYAPRDGVPFFAYARPFVRAAMRRACFRDAAIVAVPMHHFSALREGRGSARDRAFLQAAARPERLDAPDAPELGADDESGEAALIRAEAEGRRARMLAEAVGALTETERLLVARRCADGAGSIEELALRLGLGVAQARKMEARALARLRTQLILRGVTSAEPAEDAE